MKNATKMPEAAIKIRLAWVSNAEVSDAIFIMSMFYDLEVEIALNDRVNQWSIFVIIVSILCARMGIFVYIEKPLSINARIDLGGR